MVTSQERESREVLLLFFFCISILFFCLPCVKEHNTHPISCGSSICRHTDMAPIIVNGVVYANLAEYADWSAEEK